ncbi:MAG: hypothetical protein ACXWQO_01795 [Bdellovibrionota bacterium]
MNRIQSSLKAYESVHQGSSANSAQAGKGNNGNTNQKKPQGGRDEFRDILIKKIKSA